MANGDNKPVMTLDELGQHIKELHPEYTDVGDAELGAKIIKKFPQYGNMLGGASPTPATEGGATVSQPQPPSSGKPAAMQIRALQGLQGGNPQAGASFNDVGNPVITPAANESFADTMRRGAAYGKTVTPAMRAAEMKAAPGKVATVLALAPTMGAAGAGALAGADAGLYQAAKGAGYGLEAAKAAASSPLGKAILSRVGGSLTIVGAWKLLKKLGL
jgi:hypothetical protein